VDKFYIKGKKFGAIGKNQENIKNERAGQGARPLRGVGQSPTVLGGSGLVKRIRIGDRVEIGFKEGVDGVVKRKLPTSVEAILNETDVLVLMPNSAGVMIKLPVEKVFEAKFYSGASVLLYDIMIVSHPIIEGRYLTKFRLVSPGKRVQLRDFYRIYSTIEFTFSVATEQLEEGDLPLFKGLTKDFSGGGMNFSSDFEIEDGMEIYANFILDDEYIVVLGRILGRSNSDGTGYTFHYRCQFIAMPDLDHEKIMQYITHQQYKSLF